MSARKAKIKILKAKNNKNLKNEVLDTNIEYISTSNVASSNINGGKTTRKRKTTAEIVIEAINKTVPIMINDALNKTVPIMINDALNKTVPIMINDALNKTVPIMINDALNKTVPIMINDALKPVVQELESLRIDFNTIVEVNNLKTK